MDFLSRRNIELELTSVSSLSDNQSSVYNSMGTDYPSYGIHVLKLLKSIIVNRTEWSAKFNI